MPHILHKIPSLEDGEDVIEGYVAYEDTNVPEDDLKGLYLYTDIIDQSKQAYLKKELLGWLHPSDDTHKISSEVLSQCFYLIDLLYPSLFESLEMDQVYSTAYGTVIFDWEKDKDNVFSLEVGGQEIGYFIEVGGRDVKQIDSMDLMKSKKELLNDLDQFLTE